MAEGDRYSFFVSRARAVLVSSAVILIGALFYFIDPVSSPTNVATDPDCPNRGFSFEGSPNKNLTFQVETDCAQYSDEEFRELSVTMAKITLNEEAIVHKIFMPSADVFFDEKRMEMTNSIVSGFGGHITLTTDTLTAEFDGPIILRGGEVVFSFRAGTGCAGKMNAVISQDSTRPDDTDLVELSDGVRVEYANVGQADMEGQDLEDEAELSPSCLEQIVPRRTEAGLAS